MWWWASSQCQLHDSCDTKGRAAESEMSEKKALALGHPRAAIFLCFDEWGLPVEYRDALSTSAGLRVCYSPCQNHAGDRPVSGMRCQLHKPCSRQAGMQLRLSHLPREPGS